MTHPIIVTSALLYANGPLHFGHLAGAYLPADVYVRYLRMKREDVLFICGSDEYGVAITLSADMAGRSFQEHVDYFHHLNQKLFLKMDISFDHYSRTTWSGHAKTVQEFFLELYEKGFIEEKTENHLYSPEDQRFLADRYVVGICPHCGYEQARGDECQKCGASYEATDLKNPRSKMSDAPLILKPSKHWYYRFDLFQQRLLEWLEKKDWKPSVVNLSKQYIRELHARSITRDLDWGIPVPLPEAAGKVLYVWFDAPIGYISATKEWAELQHDPDLWKKYWLNPQAELIHFIGKDNIPFHTIFFPATLMGLDTAYKTVDQVPANEFFLLEGKQFSKSEGWYVDLSTFLETFTADQIRYYLVANAPENADSDFSWREFQARCNNELLAKFGNFVHRVLVFAQQRYQGKIPPITLHDEGDMQFMENMHRCIDAIDGAYAHFSLRKAAQIVMELAQIGNVYFDMKKPWVLAKDLSNKHLLDTTVGLCLECVKTLAFISAPMIPSSAQKIWAMLGFETNLCDTSWEEAKKNLPVHQQMTSPKPLFVKIEDSVIQVELDKLYHQNK
ncbi:MAG: methionine--tRNA ligase [Parachlamydiales bacterium]|nr:methionine--tRNA ligase [Parachlamydiales bacterium]